MKQKHSLFAKLLMIFFAAGIAVFMAISASFHYFGERPYKQMLDNNIQMYAQLLVEKIETNPYARGEIERRARVKIFGSIDEINRYYKQLDDYAFEPIGPGVSVLKKRHKFILRVGDNGRPYYVLIKGRNYLPSTISAGLVAIAVTFLILLFTYNRVQKIFSPIDEIQLITKEYGQGNFDKKLPVKGSGQLADLTISINDLADRIKSMLDSKRNMLLAIGHELKTPLARLRLQLEMHESPDEEMIGNINEMKTIIDSILAVEKLKDHKELVCKSTNMNQLLTKFKGPRVNIILPEQEVLGLVDQTQMDLAIRNLIQNAKKYSPQDSKIDLKLKQNSSSLTITIRDYGQGVDEKDLEKITEAFYRTDQSRHRDSGGVGLGLYLVKSIVESHRGKLVLENVNPGLEIKIVLPKSID